MNSSPTFSMVEFINLNSKKISNNNSKIQIELILQKVLGCNRIDLYTKASLAPNRKQLEFILHYIKCVNTIEN